MHAERIRTLTAALSDAERAAKPNPNAPDVSKEAKRVMQAAAERDVIAAQLEAAKVEARDVRAAELRAEIRRHASARDAANVAAAAADAAAVESVRSLFEDTAAAAQAVERLGFAKSRASAEHRALAEAAQRDIDVAGVELRQLAAVKP